MSLPRPSPASLLPILWVAAGALLSAAPASAERYFGSNAGGMRLDAIRRADVDRYEYVLVVETVGGVEVERLVHDGEEIRRREISSADGRRVMSEYRGDRLVFEEIWENGRKTEEVDYAEEAVSERRVYTYRNNRLAAITSYDAEGTVVKSVTYDRTLDGRAYRSVHREGESTRTNLYRFDGDRLYQTWLGSEDVGTLYSYSGGTVLGVERWAGDRLERIERVEVDSEGTLRTIEDFSTGKTIVQRLDRSGRVLEETVEIDGSRVERTVFRYSGGLLVEKLILSGASSNRVVYEYDENEALVRKVHYRNSILTKTTVWTAENERYEEIYRDGSPVLRVYFENDRKIREDVIE